MKRNWRLCEKLRAEIVDWLSVNMRPIGDLHWPIWTDLVFGMRSPDPDPGLSRGAFLALRWSMNSLIHGCATEAMSHLSDIRVFIVRGWRESLILEHHRSQVSVHLLHPRFRHLPRLSRLGGFLILFRSRVSWVRPILLSRTPFTRPSPDRWQTSGTIVSTWISPPQRCINQMAGVHKSIQTERQLDVQLCHPVSCPVLILPTIPEVR
jgi:hypothetical protein